MNTMCENLIDVIVESNVSYSRTLTLPSTPVMERIEACLNEFSGIILDKDCQDYPKGRPGLVISRIRSH